MPRPDPIPSQRMAMLRRSKRTMKWMALLSVAVAVVLVAQGDGGAHIHMLIATALGAGLTVLLGTGLMVLTFLSASSGHDDQAGGPGNKQ